ncbi:coniferyl aldehyde dehydrogenase [Pseudoalteromonas tetraodonis]|uniref:coniferyl aldehyde dehydrogenase n=1 Tax=Pseudoalteromonas tetraodonis TaxID=43659 RepID=UPI003A977A9B
MADNPYSPVEDQQEITLLDTVFEAHKHSDVNFLFPSAKQRIEDIRKLKKAVVFYQQALLDAMKADFGHRSEDDAKFGDILTTVLNANYAIKHIKRWMKASKRHIHVLFQPASAQVQYQPLGVVGIITPWNYPVFLALGPLITALSAGNTAIIKMSEFTPATNKVMKKLIASVFQANQVSVICGGASVAAHFTTLKFDHIVFTGSTAVGRKVMQSAAQNLTPVTLELGGKSPVIIAPDIDIKTAVSRFLMAKTLNSGQTCVAPDYLFCQQEKIPTLVEELKKQFAQMYPTVFNNVDYGCIINNAQYQRLTGLVKDAQQKGAVTLPLSDETINDGEVVNNEENVDDTARKIPLTLILDTNEDMLVMQDEIFGPLLPIVPYKNMDEVIRYINQRPTPLALYLMSFDKLTQTTVLKSTKAGGVCINEAAFHVAQDDLPFGGVGESGMGHYHGQEGFLVLSKAKPVFTRGKFSLGSLIFPPYNKRIHQLIYKLFIR